MNSFSLLPPPLNRISKVFQFLIKKKLGSKTIDFNYGCNILFGNLFGGQAFLRNSIILEYTPITFGGKVLIG